MSLFGLPFIGICRFTFSKAHKYRLQCYYSEPGFLPFVILVNFVYWFFSVLCLIFPGKTTAFYVYEFFSKLCFQPGIVNDIFDVLRFWKSRKYLQSNVWLHGWLKRELQTLMQVFVFSMYIYLQVWIFQNSYILYLCQHLFWTLCMIKNLSNRNV